MSDTIREQIISNIVTAGAAVLTTAGYNYSLGTNVYRAVTTFDTDSAIVVLPQVEQVERGAGFRQIIMPVKIEGHRLLLAGEDPSEVSEMILGDIIELMTAPTFTRAYTSGSTEITVGQTITGATSAGTGYITGVTLTSGSWAGGDAAGNLLYRRKSGDFQAENINVGASLNVATIAATATAQSALTRVTNDLAKDIEYAEGGQADIPDGSAEFAAAYAVFNIYYETLYGNPYGQPS